MRKRRNMKIALIVIVLIGAAWLLYPLNEAINLGLDLQGGFHMVLEAQDTEDRVVDRATTDSIVEVINRRVDELGVAEPIVQREGTRRIIVELPGIDDAEEAREAIGRTARLEFKTEDGEVFMTGEVLRDASAGFQTDPRTGATISVINFELDRSGTRTFARVTEQNVGRELSIYLDDELLTSPEVNEPIPSGRGYIRGFDSIEEAQEIALLLRAGALPVPVSEIEYRNVGPSLGQDLIEQSLRAGIAGLILVGIFMILFYRAMGVVADIALIIYGIIVFAVMSGIGATLTLPGVAGFILSIGMAVDANVIIFERIKEELRAGKTLRTGINTGFSKAFRAILDSNITTLISAFVLAYFGTGMIRGFAIILSIGILTSMFTAIVVTKSLLEVVLDISWIRKRAGLFGLKRGEA